MHSCGDRESKYVWSDALCRDRLLNGQFTEFAKLWANALKTHLAKLHKLLDIDYL